MATAQSKLSVFYDGLCPLCSREIDHYRKQVGSDQFNFLDITDEQFKPETLGLDPVQIHKVMHVQNKSGEIKTGVDAFIEIWKVLPRYQILSRIAQKNYIRPFLNLGYSVFAKIRPYLPRKSRDCEASPFCEIGKQP